MRSRNCILLVAFLSLATSVLGNTGDSLTKESRDSFQIVYLQKYVFAVHTGDYLRVKTDAGKSKGHVEWIDADSFTLLNDGRSTTIAFTDLKHIKIFESKRRQGIGLAVIGLGVVFEALSADLLITWWNTFVGDIAYISAITAPIGIGLINWGHQIKEYKFKVSKDSFIKTFK